MLKMMTTMLVGAVDLSISATEENAVNARYISSGSMGATRETSAGNEPWRGTFNGVPGEACHSIS